MTSWMDWRNEPVVAAPEIEEYISSDEWSLTCLAINCNWREYGERTENFIEEMHEVIDQHKRWHEESCPE